MRKDELFAEILKAILIPLCVGLAAWAGTRKARRTPAEQVPLATRFAVPKIFNLAAVVYFIMFGALLIFGIRQQSVLLVATGACFIFLSYWGWSGPILVNEVEVRQEMPLRKDVVIQWADVVSAKVEAFSGSVVIKGRDDQKIRISQFYSDWPSFARQFCERTGMDFPDPPALY
jgi:hypothetical protein